MGELLSALDALAAEDLFALPAPDVLDRDRLLIQARNRLDAEIARTTRHAELTQAAEHDGLTSMQSWLRGHCRLSPSAAKQAVRIGRTLAHLPAVSAGSAAGQISAEQVAAIASVIDPENLAKAADQDIDLAAVDQVLARTAAVRQYLHLRQVHHYLARLDPDGPEPDPTEERSVSLAKHPDGSLSGRFHLDPVGGEKFQSAVESFMQADRPAGDVRRPAERLGNALVQWADVTLASGRLPILRTVKPHIIAMIDLDDLADPATGPDTAQMGFGATISAARARWPACDSDISRVIIGPDGRVLDYGRSRRTAPPSLRGAVEIEQRHCIFAACEAPTHWCDVHHVDEWLLHDGETRLENSALLGKSHHTKVHHGFRVERQPDGRWRTYRPDGTEILLATPLVI
jgi:hypothetical protein